MSDHFEKAMQGILHRSAENGGPEIPDILTALVATNEDLDDNHVETLGLLSDHVAEDKVRAAAAARELSAWKKAQAEECAERHRTLFAEEMARRRQPRRSDDPEDVDYSGGSETRAEAKTARQKFSREQIVATFWLLVAFLALSDIVPRAINGIIHLIQKT